MRAREAGPGVARAASLGLPHRSVIISKGTSGLHDINLGFSTLLATLRFWLGVAALQVDDAANEGMVVEGDKVLDSVLDDHVALGNETHEAVRK